MTSLATGLGLGWLGAYLIFCGVALVRAARARRRPTSRPGRQRVLLLRPCCGAPDYEREALASTAHLRHGADLTIRLSVARDDDPSWDNVRRVVAELVAQGFEASAHVTATAAPNAKAGQLAALSGDAAKFAAVVVCDADVDLRGFDLDELIGPMLRDDVAAVWAPPQETGVPRTWGDRVSAAILGRSLHAFDLLGRLDHGGLVGKCFAVRADALVAAGGFAAVADRLGEDMALAQRLARDGWATSVAARPVASLARDRTLAGVVARYARWLLVMRAQRPARLLAYPLLIAAALPIAVTAPLWAGDGAWAVAGSALLARLGVVAATHRASAATGLRAVVDGLAADVVLLVAWARALTSRRTRWGGRPLTLSRDGRLVTSSGT